MKKTTIFSSALVALAMLASCQKEQLIETPVTATGVTEFTATIGQPTKTAIDTDGKVTWEIDDEITVTDAESKSAVYVATSSGASTTFTLKEDQTAVGAGPYKATYGNISNQKYSENGANCPLEANTADAGSTTLHFSSPYAVLKITAKSSNSNSDVIKTVVVTYGDNGSFLDCGNGVTLTSDGVVFYVAVQPATNANLSVTFYNTDGKMEKKTRTGTISLAAKDLLPVTFESLTWSEDPPTFKAVHNTTDGSLKFYYDNNLHVGEGVLYDNLPDAATGNTSWGYDGVRKEIKKVEINPSVAGYKDLTSTAFMFYNMINANSISGAQYLDVSNVTNMSSMFNYYGQNSTSLTDVPDVKEWDTGNVTDMNYMFGRYGQNSKSLEKKPDVKDWDTGEVTKMNNMFEYYGMSSDLLATCPEVKKWATGNVTNMACMFNSYGQSSTSLATYPDVSEWDTGRVTKMNSMFSNYGNSSKLLDAVPDVSKWKTATVTNMSKLFYEYGAASNIIECKLDLTGWNLAKLTSGAPFDNFNPKTFVVTIPAKTGNKANQPGDWYGSGYRFGPPSGKYFIPVLNGVFTVNAEGKQVHFSQGNLWYGKENITDDTSTWYFETNQYDVQSSFGDVLHVGHFFWSKSDNVAYAASYSDDSADPNDVFFTNKKTETEESAKTDFTSSGKMGVWRTLSQAEWKYLLEDRTMTNGKARYSNAMENGVTIDSKTYKGIFLYPDDYNGDIVSGSMTLEQINAAGIVFLPSTGYRSGSSISENDKNYTPITCIYWTSTADSYDEAYRMFFKWDDSEPEGSKLITDFNAAGWREWAAGIRLVTDCQ